MHRLYETNRERLIADFFDESMNRETTLHHNKIYYENNAHVVSSLTQSRLKNRKENGLNRCADIAAWSFEVKENFAAKKSKFDEKICEEIFKIFNNFVAFWPKSRLSNYDKTQTFDNAINLEIFDNVEKIRKSTDELMSLQMKYEEETWDSSWEIFCRKSKIESLNQTLDYLKHKLKTEAFIDSSKIRNLVVIAEKKKKSLKSLLTLGIRLQKMTEICGKYEKFVDFVKNLDDHFDRLKDCEEVFDKDHVINLKTRCVKVNIHCKRINSQSMFTDDDCVKSSADVHEKISKIDEKSEIINEKSETEFKDQNSSRTEFTDENSSKNTNLSQFVDKQSSPTDFPSNLPSNDLKIIEKSTTTNNFINNLTFNTSNYQISSKSSSISSKLPTTSISSKLSQKIQIKSSKSSLNESFSSHTSEFYNKLAHVETDCLLLKRQIQKFKSENEKLKILILQKRHEMDVKENIRMLRLDSSPSVGRISQISHQITQICDKMLKPNYADEIIMY